MSDAAATAEKPSAPVLKAIFGQKVGMTQVYDRRGEISPVTVIHASPCQILQVLTPERHGYAALQIGFGDVREKSLNKAEAGQFKKASVPAARWVREIRTTATGFQPGMALRVDGFAAGDYVDVSGTSKGKGFAGAMKRHNFSGGPTTHGQSDRTRATGSSGSNTYPGRVFKGKRFPGHLGAAQITVQHMEVVEVIPEKDLILLRGAVPGPVHGVVEIRQTLKRIKARVLHAAEPGKKDKAKKDAAKPAAAKPKGTAK